MHSPESVGGIRHHQRVVEVPRAPLGIFRAVLTRDGEGCARDGQPFYQCNYVWTDPRDGDIFEVLFGDGLWLLAATADLELQTPVQ